MGYRLANFGKLVTSSNTLIKAVLKALFAQNTIDQV